MISICITVKNRSRVRAGSRELLLFPNCVKSIVESVKDGFACELVVCDWNSDDWPLDDWLREAAHPLATRIIPANGTFSRGKGLNLAVASAKGKALCFLDSDVLVQPTFFRRGLEVLKAGKAFFPILFSFDGPEHISGYWREHGHGNCMVAQDSHISSGGWPEYISWGKEDKVFFERISSIQRVVREQLAGLYHQWHPDSIEWKNRYGADSRSDPLKVRDIEMAENLRAERFRKAKRRLLELISAHKSAILIDDRIFSTEPEIMKRCTKFPERKGEYWGRPADDTAAIRELKRQIESGSTLLVFAWPAFWWLEYYKRFAECLRSRFPCVLSDESLVVYDLRNSLPTSAINP